MKHVRHFFMLILLLFDGGVDYHEHKKYIHKAKHVHHIIHTHKKRLDKRLKRC